MPLETIFPHSYAEELRAVKKKGRFALHKMKLDLLSRPKLSNLAGRKGLKLNIGCGPLSFKGWVNIDFESFPGVYHHDARDPIPLADGSARHIHCEHFLEHLTQEDAVRFLRECHRLLEPGGSLRLILPDAGKYLRAYANEERAFFEPLSHLGNAARPFRTPMEIINQMFRMGGDHLFAWDFQTLALYLREVGFSHIEPSAHHDVAEEFDIDGEDAWRPHESLYLDAWK